MEAALNWTAWAEQEEGASAQSRSLCPVASWLVLGSLNTACCLHEASAQC